MASEHMVQMLGDTARGHCAVHRPNMNEPAYAVEIDDGPHENFYASLTALFNAIIHCHVMRVPVLVVHWTSDRAAPTHTPSKIWTLKNYMNWFPLQTFVRTTYGVFMVDVKESRTEILIATYGAYPDGYNVTRALETLWRTSDNTIAPSCQFNTHFGDPALHTPKMLHVQYEFVTGSHKIWIAYPEVRTYAIHRCFKDVVPQPSSLDMHPNTLCPDLFATLVTSVDWHPVMINRVSNITGTRIYGQAEDYVCKDALVVLVPSDVLGYTESVHGIAYRRWVLDNANQHCRNANRKIIIVQYGNFEYALLQDLLEKSGYVVQYLEMDDNDTDSNHPHVPAQIFASLLSRWSSSMLIGIGQSPMARWNMMSAWQTMIRKLGDYRDYERSLKWYASEKPTQVALDIHDMFGVHQDVSLSNANDTRRQHAATSSTVCDVDTVAPMTVSRVVDAFVFYNELDMLHYRLMTMHNVVDHFVLVEADTTFAGNAKTFVFEEHKDEPRFAPFLHKIHHTKLVYPLDIEFQTAWDRERYQRNAIREAVLSLDLSEHDLVVLADVDEIVNPAAIVNLKHRAHLSQSQYDFPHSKPIKPIVWRCKMDMYYYHVMLKKVMPWYHVKVMNVAMVKSTFDLDAQRVSIAPMPMVTDAGWHLSYFGSSEFISNKIAQFSHQEFNTPEFVSADHIAKQIASGADLFHRTDRERLERVPQIDVNIPNMDLLLHYFAIPESS